LLGVDEPLQNINIFKSNIWHKHIKDCYWVLNDGQIENIE